MRQKSALSKLLTRERILRLAHDTSFERGLAYLEAGRVRSLVEYENRLTATVTGTQNYEVRLSAGAGGVEYSCSCPVGMDRLFCKHCVAASLAWLGRENSGPASPGVALVKLDDLRCWLTAQTSERLTLWLLEAAEHNGRLRQRLLRRAAEASQHGIDLEAFRREIDLATDTGGFMDYHEMHGVARGIRDAIEPLNEWIEEGHASEAVALAEHALRRVEKALHHADDSDGALGSILGELQEIHLAACEKARPAPEELATRLFEWEMNGDWEVFLGAAETYAAVLGERGLAVYRARAQALWQRLPTLKPGQREAWSGERFRITTIMEALARADGSLENLVAVKAKDLSIANHFLEIAQLFHRAKRHDEALAWAERGARAFPVGTDPRLEEFLAAEYHRRGRHDDAMVLIWRQFDELPDLTSYQLLKRHSDRAESWPGWRERALATLRNHAERNTAAGRFHAEGRSELVRIFLWEQDAEAAWLEAQKGGCTGPLWLELAAARAKDHPEDAAPVYLRESENLIAQKNSRAYAEAVKLLEKARALFRKLGRKDEWSAEIARLRVEHQHKRNFISLAAKL